MGYGAGYLIGIAFAFILFLLVSNIDRSYYKRKREILKRRKSILKARKANAAKQDNPR